MNANIFCNKCHRIPSECGCSRALNAYELAKKLEWYTNYDEFVEAGTMLRQQADRIAELEDRLSMYEIKDLDRGIIGKIGDSPIHDLVHRTTPQIKELSDEEIIEVGNAVVNLIDSNEGWIEFAKAILKKASEK